MKGVTDRLAAISIMGACARQFPDANNKPNSKTQSPDTQLKQGGRLRLMQTPSGREIRVPEQLTDNEVAQMMRNKDPEEAPLFGFSTITLEQFMSTVELGFIAEKLDSASSILLFKIPCNESNLVSAGYTYGYAVFEPASRIKSPNDAYSIENGRAMTVRGCWLRSGEDAVHVRGLRLSDHRIVDYIDSISYGEWYGFK